MYPQCSFAFPAETYKDLTAFLQSYIQFYSSDGRDDTLEM